MIAYIKGELAEVEENALIIESGNIGYRVFISTQTLSELPAVGAQIKLHTYFNVREDAMQDVYKRQLVLFAISNDNAVHAGFCQPVPYSVEHLS